jgi:hypothetical protein
MIDLRLTGGYHALSAVSLDHGQQKARHKAGLLSVRMVVA